GCRPWLTWPKCMKSLIADQPKRITKRSDCPRAAGDAGGIYKDLRLFPREVKSAGRTETPLFSPETQISCLGFLKREQILGPVDALTIAGLGLCRKVVLRSGGRTPLNTL